jgi:formylglycine-generating enzyme required for sulfatase activity
MFRQVSKAALVVMVAIGSLTLATAEEPKAAGGKTKESPKKLAVDLGKGVKLELVLIPAGKFLMGSPDSVMDAGADEKPQHPVRITKPFYMGKFLVTQEQWEAVTGSNPSYFKGPKNPVEQVSWEDCQKFLGKLNAKSAAGGGKFQLPSEAQWEYACRAGSKTKYCFGDDESKLGEYAWYAADSGRKTHPVDEKKPNAWGLYDMHGNTFEWCQDWWKDGYYKESPVDDPTGPATGAIRVDRGGSWFDPPRNCRSAYRSYDVPGFRSHRLGLRVSRVPDEVPTAAVPKPDPTKQITNSIGMKLTLIPSGEFMMGSGESAEATAEFFKKNYSMDRLTADAFKDERPQHRVRVTKSFYMGTYHVTRGQFQQFVADRRYMTDAENKNNPGAFGWNPDTKKSEFNEKYSWRNAGFEQTDEHPVVNVSWNDAVEYCKWLSKKEGKTYRLPTEAEWEFACRAGTTTRYYSGDDPEMLAQVGNVADATARATFPVWEWTIKASDGYVFTSPVGKFKPNGYGLYDMHGNAWQWCADWHGADYYAKSPVDDPSGADSGSDRVLRGGSWNGRPFNSQSAERLGFPPDVRDYSIGFRVARTK